MSGGPAMHKDTLAVLQHVAVHGERTRAEVLKSFPGRNGSLESTMNNLARSGYLACDTDVTPATYTVTPKGRKKLLEADPLAPRRDPRKLKADIFPVQVKRPQQLTPRRYQPVEFAPSKRPGAMVAFTLPSRFGDELRYRDGRITDMDGNPITQPREDSHGEEPSRRA